MTERHAGYLVVLEEDMREDCAEETVLNAIKQIRGVADVVPQKAGSDHQLAREQARNDLRQKLFDVLMRGDD